MISQISRRIFITLLLTVVPISSQNINSEELLPATAETLFSSNADNGTAPDLLKTDHLEDNIVNNTDFTDDPFLAEIIEEERLLNLSRRSYFNVEEHRHDYYSNTGTQENTEEVVAEERKPNLDTPASTMYPIIVPTTEVHEEQIVPASARPPQGFGLPRFTQPVTGAIGSVGHKVKNLFTGGRDKQKSTKKSSTTTSPLPGPELSPISDDHISPEELIIPSPTPIVCNKTTDTVFADTCYPVLQKGPCNEGEWLVEDEITGKGKCEINNCTADTNTVPFGDMCVRFGSKDYCHPGMRIYTFKNGKTECDCQEGHIFNEKDGNCYAASRRGPCKSSQIFKLNKQRNQTVCEVNPCLTDGYVCNGPRCIRQRNCVELNKDSCPQGGVYFINPKTFTVDCTSRYADPIVGNVPTLVCAPGSRRDILGSCRKPSQITFS